MKDFFCGFGSKAGIDIYQPATFFSQLKKTSSLLFISTCLITTACNADDTETTTSKSRIGQSSESLSNPYGLTSSEWEDYQLEMRGARGLWSPNLHPIAVLGMKEGITASKRIKYARRMAEIEHARLEREIAFEHAYRNEGIKLFGNQALFSNVPLKDSESVSDNFTSITYFSESVCTSCKDDIKKIIDSPKPANIYVIGSKKDVQNWAIEMGISPSLVSSRKIKLHATSRAELKKQGISKFPMSLGLK